jgi:cell division protein ZapA (FtsZ GTPase activity inhibitor)
MMSEKKSYKISVLGELYSIVSDESETHVVKAAKLVDEYMRDAQQYLLSQPRPIQLQKGAVLTALRIASDLQKLSDNQKMAQYVEQQIILLIDKI